MVKGKKGRKREREGKRKEGKEKGREREREGKRK
jgi:hypothetical protein